LFNWVSLDESRPCIVDFLVYCICEWARVGSWLYSWYATTVPLIPLLYYFFINTNL